MLQWWVRAGLGAMHFLQMETPVRSFLACTQVRKEDVLPSPNTIPHSPVLAMLPQARLPPYPPSGGGLLQ